jgi:hypothetical protein
MTKKKDDKGVLPFRIGMGSTKPPMTFDEAMGVILDPANLPPKRKKPAKGGKKPGRKK